MIVIQAIQHKKEIAEFIDFVYDLYVDDPNFVPELFIAQRDHLDPDKNPFFDTAKAQLFLARDEIGRVLGRIAAVRDDNLINFSQEPVGVFGFFDVINDYKVAEGLLNAAAEWLKSEALTSMEGPYNFSINHTCGVLVEGYQYSPKVMMTYNKPYYTVFLERFGLKKKMDLLGYHLDSKHFPERLQRAAKLIETKLSEHGITVRKINLKNFIDDVKRTVHVYNQAWSKNLGYTPMSEKEFLHAAKDMKLIMDPELVLLAEKEGEVIGFSLTLPDINEVQKKIKRGRLLPFGIFKLLFNKNKIKGTRIIALGVLEEYRRLGLDAYFYTRAFQYVRDHPIFESGEASWILEHNPEMNQAIIKMGGQLQKRYRIYRKDFS